MRVDGKFVDADGNRPEGQYVRCERLTSKRRLDPVLGPLVPSPTMLRSHLSLALVERTGF